MGRWSRGLRGTGGKLKTDRNRGVALLRARRRTTDRSPVMRLLRGWLTPVVLISSFAVVIAASLYAIDLMLAGGDRGGALAHYLAFDPDLITDALPALGMTIVAVLGIVLTVIAIIVQLSSDRYTGVALMFLRDRVNVLVMVYFVIASVCAVWLSVGLQEDFVPKTLLLGVMILTSLGLLIMLPYFAYVFWFLEPGNIIDRIRFHATQLVDKGLDTDDVDKVAAYQGRMIMLIEEITDIANNSIDGRDKMITSRAVDALRDFLLDYMREKPSEEHVWYRMGAHIRENPDFVAMDIELMRDLELRWIWVEWKTLRQYLGIYNEALTSMQDINYLIAIDTRYIGEAATETGNKEVVQMVLRFLNSYLRSAINGRYVRTAYNVLHQYRLFIESLLRAGENEAALQGVANLKYYGHLSFDQDLTFVTETVAYDLVALCQFAHRKGVSEENRILRQFLDLDRPTRGYLQERGLRGVRKAQTKLACYYMAVGEETKARLIGEDMMNDPVELLHSVRDELSRVESPYFWEVVDRGRNFEYMPEKERAKLGEFFGWLDAAPPPRRRSTDK